MLCKFVQGYLINYLGWTFFEEKHSIALFLILQIIFFISATPGGAENQI